MMYPCECRCCDGCRTAMSDVLHDALCEAEELCTEHGPNAKFVVRREDHVNRDRYESIKEFEQAQEVTYNICAMDIQYQPNRQTLETYGLYEEAEVAIKTPTIQWLRIGVDFRRIDLTRTTVRLGPETFRLSEKGRENVVMNTVPLFYTFGLVKN